MSRSRIFGLILLLVPGVLGAAQKARLVEIKVGNRAAKDAVGRIIDLEEKTRGFDLFGWATPEELEKLQSLGYVYQFVAETRNPEALTMCSDPDGPPFEPPASWNCYPTYDQYVDLMNYYANNYPSICRLVDLGATQDGDHNLLALKISDNPDAEEDEPEFFYTATMHGDETTGYVLTLRLADELLTQYASDSEIAGLVDDLVIWINPLANPDGTFAGGDATVSGSQRSLANGADPNRSFPDPDSGDDPDSGSWYPEIQSMMDLAESESFTMSANFHGGAEVVNYPWDVWSARHPDDAWYQTVSHLYADTVQANAPAGYMDDSSGSFDDGITNGYDWYQVSGGRQDYMNYYRGCREVTIELSDSKTLDSNQLEAHWGYNRQAMLDFMKEALNGIRGIVTDADTGDPVAATVKVVGHDSETYKTFAYTDPDVGDYHRPIEAGTWDLQFSAEGYETATESGIVVTAGSVVRRDVQMTPLASYSISGLVTDSATGAVIAGASVELTDTTLGGVTTGSDGRYLLPGVWEGTHTLAVAASGYDEYSASVAVASDSTVFDVSLAPYQAALEEDLESDDGGFTASGSWQWGEDSTAGAASGTKVWGTVLGADYTDDAGWTLTSPTVTLGSDLDSATLDFAQWYAIEDGYDGGQVQISVDGGGFTLLTPVGGYPNSSIDGLGNQAGFTGGSGGWVSARFDLDAYIGHDIAVRWRFGSDGSIEDRGWYIDDIRIRTTGGEVPLFADGFESGNTDAWSN